MGGIVRFRFHHAGLSAGIAALVLSSATVAEDPESLFPRVKAHMSEHLAQLPNYACHETIDRLIRVRSTWRRLDTVEFEVAFVGHEELFSRPGSDRFGEQPIEKLAPGGTIGNIMLGSSIDLIFSENLADFTYGGASKKDGRKTYRYDLRVPVERSAFRIRHSGAEGLAGFKGSVWVDADTLELVRVDFKVD